MGSLTDEAERRIIDYLSGQSTTGFTAPLMVRLMTANGSEAAAGTEVVGSTYISQQMLMNNAATASGVTTGTNSTDVLFPSLDASGSRSITGYEVWDSADTPIRVFVHAFGSPVAVPATQSFRLPSGSVTIGSD